MIITSQSGAKQWFSFFAVTLVLLISAPSGSFVSAEDETWLEYGAVTGSDAAADDTIGDAVDISGDVLVVGAPSKSSDAGAVYIYRLDISVFEEEQILSESSTTNFGTSVAIDNETIVVGELGGNGAAYVYVWENSTGTWDLEDTLTASDAASGDSFGTSVDVDGDRIVVGAPDRSSSAGGAYVFDRSDSVWTQDSTVLEASTASGGDLFGTSVAVEGDAIAVGAPGSSDSGEVFAFELDGTWGETDIITPSDGSSGDSFGTSLSMSESRVLIGAPAASSDAGKVYLVTRDFGPDLQEATLDQSDSGGSDLFGSSVGLYGDTAAVGAPGYSSEDGAVYVYRRDALENTWSQVVKLLTTETGDELGKSVAIDEYFVASGAALSDASGTADAGAAHVFVQDPETAPPSEAPSQMPSTVPTFTPTFVCAEYYRELCGEDGNKYMMYKFVSPNDRFGRPLACTTRCVSRHWVRLRMRWSGYECGNCLDFL